MYTQHFGLTQAPFSIAPDPRYLFMSERHREALAHLLYGVQGTQDAAGGVVLLTGDIGAGKTTICRCFLGQIPPGCQVAYIFNPRLTVLELLQSICDEFHLSLAERSVPTVKSYIDALNVFLLQSHAQGRACVLIIDEAQNLAPDLLEQLRLLTNLETNTRKLLQIILIGQPELRTVLAQDAMEQLAQRVVARFHLGALNEAETTHYVEHRLGVAGYVGAETPFSPAALRRLHQLARGVPRRINLLADRALLGAWTKGRKTVDRTILELAAREVFGTVPEGAPEPAFFAMSGLRASAVLAGLVTLGVLTGTLAWWGGSKEPVPGKRVVAAPGSAPAVVLQPPPGNLAAQPTPVLDAQQLGPALMAQPQAAWRALAALWPLTGLATDPCAMPREDQMQCHHASKLSWAQVRQLDRPGILTLYSDSATPRYAVLVDLGVQTARLRTALGVHQVSLLVLGRLWRGDFATFWHAPADYLPDLRDGTQGTAVQQLSRDLAQLDGLPPATPAVLDAALRERVRAFQRAQGLLVDGQPGPLTFMQIEGALGLSAARLSHLTP